MTFLSQPEGRSIPTVPDLAPQQAGQEVGQASEPLSDKGESAVTGQHLSLEVLDNAIRRAWCHAIYRRNSGHRPEYHKAMDIYRKLVAMKAIQGAMQ
jgi:hypothetical protein